MPPDAPGTESFGPDDSRHLNPLRDEAEYQASLHTKARIEEALRVAGGDIRAAQKLLNSRTVEPQYEACFAEEPVVLGPMTGSTWRWNPRRLGFVLARYKFVAQMVKGFERVAEIGCADAFPSCVVRDAVGQLDLYDFDPIWVAEANKLHPGRARQLDIVGGSWDLSFDRGLARYDALYMCDVIEHVSPGDEVLMMDNVHTMLKSTGVFIAGCPSLESQVYASEISRAGHVNCRSGEQLRRDMQRYFQNVFLFGMNDEMLHAGFAPMCHYLFALCAGPKRFC